MSFLLAARRLRHYRKGLVLDARKPKIVKEKSLQTSNTEQKDETNESLQSVESPNAASEKKNINQPIIDNINFYLNQESTEYAFLISGEWGSGKTHFIDSYIKTFKNEENKIIKISLFGLNSTSDIDSKIFQELHPVLGSDSAKLVGNIVKGALSFGFKFDLNNNNKDDSSGNVKFDKLDFFGALTDHSKKTKQLVICLDDIERTGIPQKELLGYINHLVETLKIHVILIANEKTILENDKKKTYIKFKEKVIGKTFQVKHDHDEIIGSFLQASKCKPLLNSKEKIKDIYLLSDSKNLRNFKQSILDFEYFSSHINEEYLTHSTFCDLLVWTFFSLNIEIKSGMLDEASLRKNIPFSLGSGAEGAARDIHKKYFKELNTQIYSAELWADVFFNGNFDDINTVTSKLAFFVEKVEDQQPDWVKLLSFEELEDDVFFQLCEGLERSLDEDIKDSPAVYLHMIGLAIHFNQNGLSNIKLEELEATVKKKVNQIGCNELWNKEELNERFSYNGTGFRYLSEEDPRFISLRKIVTDKANKEYKNQQKYNNKKSLALLSELILTSIKKGDIEILTKIFNKDYHTKPILETVSVISFACAISSSKNFFIKELATIIYARYENSRFPEAKPISHYLSKELSFWRSVQKELNKNISDSPPLKKYTLKNFNEGAASYAIKQLSSPD